MRVAQVRVVKTPEEARVAEERRHTVITGTASAIRVIVDSRDHESAETFSTVGVGTNIIEASWRALVDAVEYKLSRDDARWATQARSDVLPHAGLMASAKAKVDLGIAGMVPPPTDAPAPQPRM